jgi:ubiquinone/menaquinone biosynthesis C-methylase UbiE
VTQDHDALTERQFGAHAQAYVESAVHAGGADLAALTARAAGASPKRALDLGVGGGHVAYALAGVSGAVAAVDLSADMLAAVAAEAERRGLSNIETFQASAEDLPFPDACFDFVASRFSAHHWRDASAGLRQARRVLRDGATAIFIDIVSPGEPALDTHLQAVELLRDVSHVRDFSMAEWRAMLADAGFSVEACESWRLRMDFAAWTRRIGTPAPLVEAIRLIQQKASAETRSYFAVEADGSFLLDAALFVAVAA